MIKVQNYLSLVEESLFTFYSFGTLKLENNRQYKMFKNYDEYDVFLTNNPGNSDAL